MAWVGSNILLLSLLEDCYLNKDCKAIVILLLFFSINAAISLSNSAAISAADPPNRYIVFTLMEMPPPPPPPRPITLVIALAFFSKKSLSPMGLLIIRCLWKRDRPFDSHAISLSVRYVSPSTAWFCSGSIRNVLPLRQRSPRSLPQWFYCLDRLRIPDSLLLCSRLY